MVEIDLSKIKEIDSLREDLNLFLYNNNLAGLDELKTTNKVFKELQKLKINISINN